MRIVLEVRMDLANPLLDRCRQLCHQQWRKELATLLQQMAQTVEGAVRLSPVVLDLGEIPLAQFDEQFCQRLLSALADKLQRRVARAAVSAPLTYTLGRPPESNGKRAESGMETAHSAHPALAIRANARETNAQTPPLVAATLGAQFATYLTFGVTTVALRECLLSCSDDWLRVPLNTEPAAWRRLLAGSCLSSDALVRLLQSVGEAGLGELCDLVFERKGDGSKPDQPAWAFCLMLGALLTQVRVAPSQIPAPDRISLMPLIPAIKLPPPWLCFLAEAVVELCSHLPSPALLSWLRMLCFESGQWQHLAPHISDAKRHRVHQRLLEEGRASGHGRRHEASSASEPFPTKEGTVASSESAPLGPGQAHLKSQDLSTVMHESWPVSNAGLVLLWPLLPGLFSRLGLQEHGQFIDRRAQLNAACWLDEWLWQDQTHAQWRNPLTKLLCAIAVDTSLFPWPEPDAQVMASLDELLATFLAQTPALTGCSENEVRLWFLQRPGWLHYQDQQWTLQVEDDACDVLLLDLPWSKNHVLLPWMDSPLNVAWP
nr:contractile injection system tape measure protein [Pseudomonas fluorescens]